MTIHFLNEISIMASALYFAVMCTIVSILNGWRKKKKNYKNKLTYFLVPIFSFTLTLIILKAPLLIFGNSILSIILKLGASFILVILACLFYFFNGERTLSTSILGSFPLVLLIYLSPRIDIIFPSITSKDFENFLTLAVNCFTIFNSAFMVGIIISWYNRINVSSLGKDRITKTAISNIIICLYYWIGIFIIVWLSLSKIYMK